MLSVNGNWITRQFKFLIQKIKFNLFTCKQDLSDRSSGSMTLRIFFALINLSINL